MTMTKQLSFYLQKYKYVGLPLLFVIVGICIIFFLILPGISSVGAANAKLAEEEKKLSDFKNTATLLKGIDDSQLTQQEQIAVKALPISKDIQEIYLALLSSSVKADVILRGFSVKVGDIFQKNVNKKDTAKGTPFITVSIQLSQANLQNLYEFTKNLSNHSPLNNSVKATLASGESNMDINFYYKPIDQEYLKSKTVEPVSKDELNTLQTLVNRSK